MKLEDKVVFKYGVMTVQAIDKDVGVFLVDPKGQGFWYNPHQVKSFEIKGFNGLLAYTPKVYKDQYLKCIDSLERPDFHPERFLHRHIEICTERALKTKNANLIMAAMLHDICKPDIPYSISNPERYVKIDGVEYKFWSNPNHADQATKFIDENKSIQKWVEEFGANLETVKVLVKEHMRFKSFLKGERNEKGGMKAIKRERMVEEHGMEIIFLLREFAKIDNMLCSY